MDKRCIALVGDTGVGKTYNLMRLLEKYGHSPLICRSLEDLKEFRLGPYTDIVFDDIDFSLKKAELLINLCDTDFPASVRILYDCVRIPPSVRRWFTNNAVEAYEPILCTTSQQAAINRRLRIVQVYNRTDTIATIEHQLCPNPPQKKSLETLDTAASSNCSSRLEALHRQSIGQL